MSAPKFVQIAAAMPNTRLLGRSVFVLALDDAGAAWALTEPHAHELNGKAFWQPLPQHPQGDSDIRNKP